MEVDQREWIDFMVSNGFKYSDLFEQSAVLDELNLDNPRV